MSALVVEGLTVTYLNGHRALTDVDLHLAAGDVLGLVGRSGCGKTTLLRAVLGLLPPRTTVAGTVRVGEHDLLAASRQDVRALRGTVIGYVAQDPYAACDPMRRVRHHVEEAWTSHRRQVPTGAVVEGLAGVGIPDPQQRSAQHPHQWSGGMLQRATTLAATVHAPLLTLADEPTSALDADLADGALDLLARTSDALLLVSHDLALVARHAGRVVVLDGGRVVERGPSAHVLDAPQHDVTRSLVRASVTVPHRPAPVSPAAPVVRLTQAARSYGDVRAVRGVDLDVRPGEVVGIVGASGSGKSTLLRLAAGMERPDGGRVLLGDAPVWTGSSARPALPRPGFVMPVFQDPVGSLDPRWSLWRTITEPLVLAGTRMSRGQRRDRARAELTAVGLGDLDVDRLPGSLSVGQCQRVAIARALVAGPALLVADEPTASLDVDAAAVVGELLRAAADRGAAVLVVTHDEPRLSTYADRVLRMADGVLT